MARPLRALVLSPEAPYPIHGGGQLRTASILGYLRQRYEVHVVTFHEAGRPLPAFPGDIRVHVIDLPHHSKSPWARLLRNAGRGIRGVPPLVDRFAGFGGEIHRRLKDQRFDVGLIEHFWCAPYVDMLRPICNRLIVDLIDIDSVLLQRQARGPLGPLFRTFASACRRMEQELLPRFDGVMVTSPADAGYIDVPSVVYPNTIPYVPLPSTSKEDCIAFSGNMEYEPNTTGVRWFHGEIWPRLRHRVSWKLIGRNEHAIRKFVNGDPRITVTGPVDDAISELSCCRAAVVPLLAGSGTRVKIVEAWAAALPVISTTIGAEGLPSEAILIADRPEDFADAIESVLDDPAKALRLGTQGRHLYEEHLTWQAAWSTLKEWGL